MKFGFCFLFLFIWTAYSWQDFQTLKENLEFDKKETLNLSVQKQRRCKKDAENKGDKVKQESQEKEKKRIDVHNEEIKEEELKRIHNNSSKNSIDNKRNEINNKNRNRERRGRTRHRQRRNDLSLWIDENQVRMFSGYTMEIYAIVDGKVMPYILDPDFEDQLPIIPSEVTSVNFTWKSGRKRYYYDFSLLASYDQKILQHPIVSVQKKGRVPKKPKVFSVHIPCAGNVSGVATFGIELVIRNGKGDALPDTPLRLRLRKQCELTGGPDPACDEKCANGGICDSDKRCRCPEGYMGQFCKIALCYPQCRNGGECSSPGRCSCPIGYHGRYCEGGICRNKCLNGGKCIQKDTCSCQKGYYGNRCEFSKCVIPCVNGGKCRGVNKCRCKDGFSGDHCEIITNKGLSRLHSRCVNRCRHGVCVGHGSCQCDHGYSGKWCRSRGKSRKKKNHPRKTKLWV